MLKRRRGSLTVEAVLILPIFMAAILFISYFIKVHYVQDVIQDALTEAVMEVSSLSYPYYLSGALEFKGEVHQETQNHIRALKEDFLSISGLIESVGDASGSGEAGGTEGGITPLKMLRLAKLYTADQGMNYAEDTLARALILGTMGNILSVEGRSVIDRMDALGIENGLDGLDFTGSVFYGEDDVLDIQVQYTLDRVDPFGFIKDVTLKNRVVCRAWMGGVDINQDGSYSRVTVPPRLAEETENPDAEEDRALRTCYIITDSETSAKYHLDDCPNLRVRGDPSQRKTVAAVQVSFVRANDVWVPEEPVAYRGKAYDFCGNCQAGIIRMKD